MRKHKLALVLLVATMPLVAVSAFSIGAGAAPMEMGKGVFIVRCKLSHTKQVDPIVNPGPPGTMSGHMHDFFGNNSTDSFSTYNSMIASTTTCGLSGDKAGYWAPSLVAPNGSLVKPVGMLVYYRNNPVRYGTTTAFPKDFRMIAGGVGTGPPNVGWSCDQQALSMVATPPSCGSQKMVAHVRFPSCWDGKSLDSPTHRSHVAYAVNNKCPSTHPVKVPEIFLHVRYPNGVSGSSYRLSDGTVTPHMDFWNTWDQATLERLVRDCLQAGRDCGEVVG
jgi:uncharacterized protein DUF1996